MGKEPIDRKEKWVYNSTVKCVMWGGLLWLPHLEIIVVILALLIIGVVVAQKSKTQGMGAGFGGGAEDLFGSRARGMDALLF